MLDRNSYSSSDSLTPLYRESGEWTVTRILLEILAVAAVAAITLLPLVTV